MDDFSKKYLNQEMWAKNRTNIFRERYKGKLDCSIFND